ncbi:MAG: LysM peptidoglycan-binding domain-containing protein [Gammaproteobacteria bacterium]
MPLPSASPPKPPSARNIIRANVPVRYVVRAGDTLWGIASRYLRSPWRWPDIWYLNSNIQNPDLIYPGDVILLGYEHGRRELTIERGGSIVASTSLRRLRSLLAQRHVQPALPIVTLRPKIIMHPLGRAIAVIPYADIAPFFQRTEAIGANSYRHLPYILRSVRRMPYDASPERVYVRGLSATTRRHFAVIHVFRAIRDPSTGDRLGYEIEQIGRARLIRSGNPALFELTQSHREIDQGDRLIPISQAGIRRNIHPTLPSKIIQGQIVAVIPNSPDISQYAIVIINRGRIAGLKSGNVLDIFRPGESLEDPMVFGSESGDVHIRPLKVGTALVFKTYARFSYALVMTEHWQVHVLAPVASPQINPRNVKFIKVARPWD